MDKKEASSFISASTLPTKLLTNNIVRNGKIIPVHMQYYLTNSCNLHCSFCSVRDIDKTKSIPYDLAIKSVDVFSKRGARGCTLSGGGEPLLYPKINEFIDYIGSKEIKAGLTTNGLLLDKLKYHDNLTWARISCSDDREPVYSIIEKALRVNPATDWAFSYVVTANPNFDRLNRAIEFAKKNDFTHVRVVNDLMDSNSPEMDRIRKEVRVDDSRVIYQGRKEWTRGSDCYMHLLKPVIAPEGIITCCAAQYSTKSTEGHYDPRTILGRIEDLASILDNQQTFNGSICERCYYMDYNTLLGAMKSKPKHNEFV